MNFQGHSNTNTLLRVALLLAISGAFAYPVPKAAGSKSRQALSRAEQGITQYRQGSALVRVFDRDGKPVSGARLKIEQVSHDFNFGCYLVLRDLGEANRGTYEQRFRQLFNYATVAFYWHVVERERGQKAWENADAEVDLGTRLGIQIKGHPLVWGADRAGTPRWLPTDSEELTGALKLRVQETVARYRGRVTTWDVVNEPLEGGVFEDLLGRTYISSAFRWAREADPQARLVINEYGILSAQSTKREPYLRLLQSLAADGVPFDAIGIQAHEPRTEWFDPAVVMETFDQYAAVGKPIHITEFTTQADGSAITGGYQSGNWNPDRQAEYYREFFTTCFGHPQVEAITVWGLDAERAWLDGGALLDAQWQPKPAYQALDQLINHQWHTSLTGNTSGGAYRLRGFYGDYEVEAELPTGSKVTQRFSLRRGAVNEWTLRYRGTM